MTAYVITLEPEFELFSKIKELKSIARELVGKQLYLDDEPHLTLYIGEFNEFNNWDKEFSELVKRIKDNYITINKENNKAIKIEIRGWQVFASDKVTNKNTLVCQLGDINIPTLRKIQEDVIICLNKYRKPDMLKRYKQAYENMDEILKENLNNYGYPFVGKIWDPHFGIASFDKRAFDSIWYKLKEKRPKGFYTISAINIYELNQDTEELNLIKKYQLNQ